MTEQDYKDLERLLGKLSTIIKNRFCIIPSHINESVYIGVYGSSGHILNESNGVDIKSTVENLNN